MNVCDDYLEFTYRFTNLNSCTDRLPLLDLVSQWVCSVSVRVFHILSFFLKVLKSEHLNYIYLSIINDCKTVH